MRRPPTGRSAERVTHLGTAGLKVRWSSMGHQNLDLGSLCYTPGSWVAIFLVPEGEIHGIHTYVLS